MNKLKVNIVCRQDMIPAYITEGSVGMDLRADLSGIEGDSIAVIYGVRQLYMKPEDRALIPTGIKIAIPKGYECQVRSRSGLALKQGLIVLNSPGTIDSDFRGEIGVILYNASGVKQYINHRDRIAQLVFNKIELAEIEFVEELEFAVECEDPCYD